MIKVEGYTLLRKHIIQSIFGKSIKHSNPFKLLSIIKDSREYHLIMRKTSVTLKLSSLKSHHQNKNQMIQTFFHNEPYFAIAHYFNL